MARHLQFGEMGEELAVRFLKERGLRILERRVRMGKLEIDIVARDGREWVFVEVKARGSDRFGRASEAMPGRKSMRLRKAVSLYLSRYGLEREPVRHDFVGIDFDAAGEPEITYYKGGGF